MAVISTIIIVGLKKIFENLLTNLPSDYLSMQLVMGFITYL